MAHKGIIHDWDARTETALNGAGAVNTASGVALIFLSDTIHIVIGVILILTGLFLFYWAATKHRRWTWEALKLHQEEEERKTGDDSHEHSDPPA